MVIYLTNKKIGPVAGILEWRPKSMKTAIFEKSRISEKAARLNENCSSLVIFWAYFGTVSQRFLTPTSQGYSGCIKIGTCWLDCIWDIFFFIYQLLTSFKFSTKLLFQIQEVVRLCFRWASLCRSKFLVKMVLIGLNFSVFFGPNFVSIDLNSIVATVDAAYFSLSDPGGWFLQNCYLQYS